jgi:hypothetical protein
LEYLNTVTGPKTIVRFVKRLGDMITGNDSCLVTSLHPWGLEQKDVETLVASFDTVERRGVGARVVRRYDGQPLGPGRAYLFVDKSSYGLLRRFKDEALCLSTVQPAKLRRWYDFQGEVIWISESGSEGAVHPGRLAMEVKQAVIKATGRGHSIFIDSLEHLVMYTDFRETVGFLKTVIDACSRSGTLMMASVNPGSLEKEEVTVLRKMFDETLG